jgi:hypothetical protein
MHSLQEILAETRKDSNLCCALERGGIVCYKKKYRTNKYCGMHQSRLSRFKSFDLPSKKVKSCKFIDCNEKPIALGYCNKHYRKTRIHKIINKCEVEGCNSASLVKNLCNKHYRRLRRHGDVHANFSHLRYRPIKEGHIPHNKGKFTTKICIAPGCEVKNGEPYRFTKGLCKKHYTRWKKFRDYNIASKKDYEEKLKK